MNKIFNIILCSFVILRNNFVTIAWSKIEWEKYDPDNQFLIAIVYSTANLIVYKQQS